MVKYDFFMNSFIAVSLDTYNKKEQILYCVGYADEFFNGSKRNVTTESRELGEFVFDFSSNLENYSSEKRQNLLYEYLSEYQNFIEVNAQRWKFDDDLTAKHNTMTEMTEHLKKSLLSDTFFETQKHLSLNDRHKLSSYEMLKQYGTEISGHMHYFYVGDYPYMATDFDFIGLLQYYLDELYNVNLFPRSCMSCGRLFLSGKKHGDVLCSAECRKKKKSQNTMTYYGNLSENEILYTKIYRKWKQRIDRAEENRTVSEKGIEQLRQELRELTEINRTRANERKKGNVPEKDGVPDYESFDRLYYEVLMSKDRFLYTLFNSLKGN